METIEVAIAGFGKGARIYNAPVISSVPGLKITRLMTNSSENIKAAKKDFPKAEIVSDYDALLTGEDINLVVITAPNHLHAEMTEKALKAGKHVVVEKPFTSTSKEAEKLIKLAKEKNLILSVHHNRRWDSDFLTVKKLLTEKKLGEVVEYEAHFDRFRNFVKEGWKEKKENPGSGILYDLGSHLIDQALVLFGTPTEVFADLQIQRENSEVIDNFEVLLFYPGLRVILKAGMLVKEKGPTYSLHGQKGSFLKYGADVQEEALIQGKLPKDHLDWGIEPQEIWGKLNTEEEEKLLKSEHGDYRKLYQNIYNAICGKEKLKVTPEQAKNVIKVIELAKSSNSGKCRMPFR